MLRALDGGLDGLFVMGQNPAVGSQHSGLQRRALAPPEVARGARPLRARDRDVLARRPRGPLGRAAHGGHPDRGVPDAGRLARREGRALHEHPAAAAVARQGDRAAGRRALGAVVHAPPVQARARALRGLDATTATGRSSTSPGTTPRSARSASPTPRRCSRRSTATTSPTGEPVSRLRRAQGRRLDRLRAAGSTPAATRTASTRRGAATPATSSPRAAGSRPSGRGRGRPTAAMLYNRASADPEGRPWSERKKYVWWDEEQGKWTGYDVPDFPRRQAARPTGPSDDAKGMDAIGGTDPFIMMADGKGWLYSPAGLLDGPMPTHYEPLRVAGGEPALPRARLQPGGADLEPPGQPGPRRRATRATRSSRRRSGSPSTTPRAR